MTTKPEWERLADVLEFFWGQYHGPEEPNEMNAATELRRLGLENSKQAEQLKAITHLVHQLHQAKGRYHTQRALCALFDAFGLPNVKLERKTK